MQQLSQIHMEWEKFSHILMHIDKLIEAWSYIISRFEKGFETDTEFLIMLKAVQ
jgi:hypothetical protein